jgi:stage V sporulation protein SpoVS
VSLVIATVGRGFIRASGIHVSAVIPAVGRGFIRASGIHVSAVIPAKAGIHVIGLRT